MPATPNLTLTATLDDLAGAAVGTTADPSKLRICLCGFGPLIPRIAGTAIIAKTGPTDILSTGGAISTAIWGNDQITPSGTFYSIEILDGDDNVVQCGAYQLTGSGTVDLSNLTAIVFPGSVLTPTAFLYLAPPFFQWPSETVDGVNTQFTFQASAGTTPQVAVFAGGAYQSTADYTIAFVSGTTWQITFTSAPPLGPIGVMLFAIPGQRSISAPGTINVSGANPDNTLFCNFSAPGTITMPSAATAGVGYVLTFVDDAGNAAANNITLSGSINGAASYVISTNYGSVTLKSNGSAWRIISKV